MDCINFERYDSLLERSLEKQLGKVSKVVGLTIESIGPAAKPVSYTHLDVYKRQRFGIPFRYSCVSLDVWAE